MKIRFLAVAVACMGISSTAFADEICPVHPSEDIKTCDDYLMDALTSQVKCHSNLLAEVLKNPSSTSSEFERNIAVATFQNKYAEYVFNHNCPVQAKKLYIDVIDTYYGPNYEAEREHAMIGIQDIRDSQKK